MSGIIGGLQTSFWSTEEPGGIQFALVLVQAARIAAMIFDSVSKVMIDMIRRHRNAATPNTWIVVADGGRARMLATVNGDSSEL